MAGENLNDLLRRVTGMDRIDVSVSQVAWEENGKSLGVVEKRLRTAAPLVRDGFGEDTDVGREAEAALLGALLNDNRFVEDVQLKLKAQEQEVEDAAAEAERQRRAAAVNLRHMVAA